MWIGICTNRDNITKVAASHGLGTWLSSLLSTRRRARVLEPIHYDIIKSDAWSRSGIAVFFPPPNANYRNGFIAFRCTRSGRRHQSERDGRLRVLSLCYMALVTKTQCPALRFSSNSRKSWRAQPSTRPGACGRSLASAFEGLDIAAGAAHPGRYFRAHVKSPFQDAGVDQIICCNRPERRIGTRHIAEKK